MIDDLTNKYNEIKGIIDVLPTNNKPNRKRKLEYLEGELKNDDKRLKSIIKEIDARLSQFESLKVNPEINKLESEIEKCNIVNEWNSFNTSYEKMHLDYYLYQLHKYYKEDLQSVNACIRKIIESFQNVLVILKEEDFNYNNYAREYVNSIIIGKKDDELKTIFENLYWKNPEIIKTIEVNFKSIYLKNEKNINKYYEKRHLEFLEKHQDQEIYDLRINLSQRYTELVRKDKYLNFNKFITEEYHLGDFKDTDKRKEKYFINNNYNYSSLLELYNIINEYKIITQYKYILDDMKNKLENKDSLKNSRLNVLKKIIKEEKQLEKLNNSQNKKSLFGKKKNNEKWLFDYRNFLNNIMESYKELDKANFEELVYNKLSKDSVILDVLKLISSNYLYFVKMTKDNTDDDISTINTKFEELKKYLNSNNFYLLNNIALLDEKQMKQLIVDKYNLEHINLTQEDLLDDNLDNTINELKNIMDYENIQNSKIDLSYIYLYLEYQKIKEK